MASSINAITTGSGGVITTADNSGNLNLQSGGTTVAAVTSSGVAVTGTLSASTTGQVGTTLGVGNATPSASGAGITFPATQSASTDANTLDDYEEGTWTPTDASGAGLSLPTKNCFYRKVGKICHVYGVIQWAANASGLTAKLGSLPYTVASGTNGFSTAVTLTSTGVVGNFFFNQSDTTVSLSNFASGAVVTNATMSGNYAYFSVVYPTLD
jgi:hypothetical protein